jgi:asparagine synthase (glutamine-hydrolysing)
LNGIHKNNLVRTNKAMMYGGKVELRTPFLNKDLIDFGLRIPTRYRDEKDGKGNIMKYVLREAFRGEIPDELLWRPKKTFQIGCHTDYLKNEKEKIENYFEDLFVNHNVPDNFIKRHIGHNQGRISIIIA